VQHRQSRKSDVWEAAPILEIRRVEAIFNPRLQRKYELELSDIQGKLQGQSCTELPELKNNRISANTFDDDCREYFLLHGAPKSKVHGITTGGLDPRRGGESTGNLFGHASYLALNASKADLYTDEDLRNPETRKCDERQIVIIRAALGNCYRTKGTMSNSLHPPYADDGKPMDSVMAETRENGGVVDHLEVMLYSQSQMLPVAVVTYKHVPTCVCALCKRRFHLPPPPPPPSTL